MRFCTRLFLVPGILLALAGCDSTAPQPNDGEALPKIGAPTGTLNGASGTASAGASANNGATRGDDPGQTPVDRGPGADPPQAPAADAPLLCPHCKPNPGGQTGDFGNSMAEPCPMPNRPLDAALEQRFRSAELRAAATRDFSQQLTWGDITESLGLQNPSADTTITGTIRVDGEFLYSPCTDSVHAPATIRFATADGKLALALQGGVGLGPHELGWPAGTAPVFTVGGGDDLSTAHGTLDIGVDPSKVQMGELFFSLVGLADGVYGSLRIRMHDFADEATRQAAQQPTDTPPPRVIHEVAVAQFPRNHCDGHGRPVALDQALPELGGATAQQVFADSSALLGAEHPIDATWLDDGATSVVIDLGEPPAQGACVQTSWNDPWMLRFASGASARSEDGKLDVSFASTEIGVRPYTGQVQRVLFPAPLDQPTGGIAWPDGLDAPSDGAINPLSGQDGELAWPPCAHAEPCNPENDADNSP